MLTLDFFNAELTSSEQFRIDSIVETEFNKIIQMDTVKLFERNSMAKYDSIDEIVTILEFWNKIYNEYIRIF